MSSVYDPCPCNSGKKFKFCCQKQIQASTPEEIAKLAIQYPLHLCLIGQDWEEMGITNILVTRQMPNDTFIVGLYLLDVWCLGVKSADLKINIRYHELISLKKATEYAQKLIPVPYLRSLVLGGVAYADSLGFIPHPDWIEAQHLIEPSRSFVDKFQFGIDGRPYYVAGPYDENCDEIIEKVQKINGDWMSLV